MPELTPSRNEDIFHETKDPKADLLSLLEQSFPEQDLFISLLREQVLGQCPFKVDIHGILLCIVENDPDLDKKIAAFLRRLREKLPEVRKEAKNPAPEPERKVIEETRKDMTRVQEEADAKSEIVWQGTVRIDYGRSWQECVDAARFTFRDKEFLKTNFPLREDGEKNNGLFERHLFVLEIKKDLITQEVLEEISKRGFVAACTIDFLTYTEVVRNKSRDRDFKTFALGSSAPVADGARVVPVLVENYSGWRKLSLDYHDRTFYALSRFLVRGR